MANLRSSLGQGPVAVLLHLLSVLRIVSALNLGDLLTVQPGGSNGGCDAYYDAADPDGTVLDNWQTESIYSISAAIDAIVNGYTTDVRVRRAMMIYFGIPVELAPGADADAYAKMRADIAGMCAKEFLEM